MIEIAQTRGDSELLQQVVSCGNVNQSKINEDPFNRYLLKGLLFNDSALTTQIHFRNRVRHNFSPAFCCLIVISGGILYIFLFKLPAISYVEEDIN